MLFGDTVAEWQQVCASISDSLNALAAGSYTARLTAEFLVGHGRSLPMQQLLPQAEVDSHKLAKHVLAHWEREIGSAAVIDEPFQHFYSDAVWPADVYDQLLQNLPPRDLYRPLNIKQWVNAKGESTRDKCYLSETIDRMDSGRAAFWTQIALAISSESLKRLLFRKFKRDIALRLRMPADEVEDAPVFVGISLTRDIQDYRLKPHTDGVPRVVTAQFYLPADFSQQDLGTSIYVKVPTPLQLFRGRYREIKRMPFVPNSGYAFAVNDLPERSSFHGRELIESGSGVRNSILVSWLSENKAQTKAVGEGKRGELWETHRHF
jgi:hypothetical protein